MCWNHEFYIGNVWIPKIELWKTNSLFWSQSFHSLTFTTILIAIGTILHKYNLWLQQICFQFGQIQSMITTNIFFNLDKYNLMSCPALLVCCKVWPRCYFLLPLYLLTHSFLPPQLQNNTLLSHKSIELSDVNVIRSKPDRKVSVIEFLDQNWKVLSIYQRLNPDPLTSFCSKSLIL